MEHQCNCGSSHSEGELGVQYNLYEKIDQAGAECLNESEEGSGIKVFKPWEERLNHDKFVESDADDELLFNIPFTGNVKLKGIIIVGGPEGSHPSKVKLFKNREHMTFDEVGITPDQEFELVKDDHGVHEYPIKVVKFSSVHHLSLHFTGNSGADNTRIDYIGLKGEWTPAHRHGVTICTYEAFPQASDHLKEFDTGFNKEAVDFRRKCEETFFVALEILYKKGLLTFFDKLTRVKVIGERMCKMILRPFFVFLKELIVNLN